MNGMQRERKYMHMMHPENRKKKEEMLKEEDSGVRSVSQETETHTESDPHLGAGQSERPVRVDGEELRSDPDEHEGDTGGADLREVPQEEIDLG